MSSDKLTQEELVDKLSEELSCTKAHALDLLSALQESIEEGLIENGICRFSGLGVFRLKWQEERQGYNPATQSPMTIAAQNRVDFTVDGKLAEAVNHKFSHLKAITLDTEAADNNSESNSSMADLEDHTTSDSDEIESNSSSVQKDEEKINPERRHFNEDFEKEPKEKNILKLILLILLFLMPIGGGIWYFGSMDNADELTVIEDPIDENAMIAEEGEDLIEDEGNDRISPSFTSKEETHQIRRGESLWSIAEQHYGHGYLWVFIFVANQDQITNPDLIFTGNQIILPDINDYNLQNKVNNDLINAYKTAAKAFKPYSTDKERQFSKESNRLSRLI